MRTLSKNQVLWIQLNTEVQAMCPVDFSNVTQVNLYGAASMRAQRVLEALSQEEVNQLEQIGLVTQVDFTQLATLLGL